jgi:hypothetical protein
MADLPELELDRLPVFRIRFELLATHADAIIAVYEQDAGGEVTELGKISTTPHFDKSYALPRDYAWLTDRNLDTEADVVAVAATVYFNDDLGEDEIRDELGAIVMAASENGIDLTVPEVVERLDDRDESSEPPVSYSWIHLNEFRLFELHGRCLAWSDPDDLRDVVEKIP